MFGRHKVVAQGEHREQGRIAGFVAEIVAELAACQLGTRRRLGGHEARLPSFENVVAHKREGDAAEVRASAEAGNHYVGVLSRQRHLLFGLEADDGLVECDVAQNGTERIFAVGSFARQLDGLGDCRAERALMVGMGG